MENRSERSNLDWVAIVILSILVIIFSLPFVFLGGPLFGSDFLLYFLPSRDFLTREIINQKTLPFWNPYLFSGSPFLANPQTAFFYPLTWLFLIFDIKFAYGYFIFIHLILSSLFMYFFGRTTGLGFRGSVVASLVFTFGGFPQAHIFAGHLTFWQTYAWLPLILTFYLKAYKKNEAKYLWATGLIVGIQLLGGFPQLSFYSLLTLLLLGFYLDLSSENSRRLCPYPSAKGGIGRFLQAKLLWRLAYVASPIFIGLGLAAIQLIPSLEFAALSSRSGGLDYQFATVDSIPPYYLLTMIMPEFFGTSTERTFWGGEGEWQFWEFNHYLGVIPLIFLIFLKFRRYFTRFFVILALISLFLALGKYNPFYRFVFYLPGFHHFRLPAQILYLFTFALAWLAGKGMEDYLDDSDRVSKRLTISCIITGILLLTVPFIKFYDLEIFRFFVGFFIKQKLNFQEYLALAERYSIAWRSFLSFVTLLVLSVSILALNKLGILSKKILFPLILAILITDIWSFAFKVIKTHDYQMKDQKNAPFLQYLRKDQEVFRILDLAGYFWPNEETTVAIQSIEGYDPLILKRYLQYINITIGNPKDQQIVNMTHLHPIKPNLINMLNVRYFIAHNKGKDDEWYEKFLMNEPIYQSDSLYLYENPNSLPRAFLVPRVKTLPSPLILHHLAEEDINLKDEAIIEERYLANINILDKDLGDLTSPKKTIKGEVEIISYQPNSINLKVSNESPAILVLSEIYYPAWRAEVDGRSEDIFPVNYLFRGMALPSGSHEVRFYYSPWLFQLGGIISLMVMGCSLIVFLKKSGYST